MQHRSSNLLRLGTRLGTKVFSILLLNLLFCILLSSLISQWLIAGVEFPVEANMAYNIGGGEAIRLLKLEFNLLIEGS